MDRDSQPDSRNATPFVLQTQQDSSREFVSKADSIFGSLGGLEQKYQSNLTERHDDFKKRGYEDDEDDGYKGQFKKPNLPSQRSSQDRRSDTNTTRRSDNSSRTTRDNYRSANDRAGERRWENRDRFSRPTRGRFHQPDYKTNPDKWTAYNLEDTSLSGEKANRSVALDFITDLRKRKQNEIMADDGEGEEGGGCKNKMSFHKPAKKADNENDDIDELGKRKHYGGVYRMTEYVVGAGNKKPKSKHLITPTADAVGAPASGNSLALDHLEENVDSNESMDIATESSPSKPPIAATDSSPLVSSSSDVVKAVEEAVSDTSKCQFKFGKGKAKRKIRARQVDDD